QTPPPGLFAFETFRIEPFISMVSSLGVDVSCSEADLLMSSSLPQEQAMDEPHNDNLDRAVARRLAILRSMPIDVSRLEKRVKTAHPISMRVSRVPVWRQKTMALAASITLVGAMLGALMVFVSRPQTVSAADL